MSIPGAQFTVFASSSLTSGTPVTGTIIDPEGCKKLALQFLFNGTPAVAGSGVSGSFGLQCSLDGTNWENMFGNGLIGSTFVVVSGTQVNGVEQGIGVSESSIKTYEFDRPTMQIRAVFMPRASRGSITGKGIKV